MNHLAVALPFDFEQPAWLWLCLLIPLLILLSRRSLAGLDPYRRTLAIIARSTLILLLACCLAGIVRVQRNKDLTVLFLMDRSHSVESMESFQESYISKACAEVPAEDRVGVIDFARDAYLEQMPMRGGYHIEPGRLSSITNTDRTNVASAMRLAMALFPYDSAKRIVLLSDGNDNMGDVLTEARRARADGIPIDVVPLWYQHKNEVIFEKIIAPAYAEPGEQVPLPMIITSDKPTTGTVSIFHNGSLVPMSAEQSRVTLQAGRNTLFMKLNVDSAGAHTFKATFRPDDESMDATAANNTASGFTFVSGKGRVLLLSADPQQDQALYDALTSENVKVVMKTPAEIGEFGLVQMMSYASIILANIPAAAFTDQQQQDLATYVKDMGSGLIMTGGDESFGAGGWIGSPVEEVMPVSFEIKHKKVIPRGALVIIMHSCEVGRGNYWGKEMAKKSVDTISSQDYFGMLAYTWSPGGENWEVPLGPNTNKGAVKAKIDRMQIGDMPDFDATLRMAYTKLTGGIGKDAAQKHIIILSDGDAQPPRGSLLNDLAREKISVSTIAIGWGGHVQQGTMRRISTATKGRFYAARNPRQLPQIFSKESKVVRRPLIVDDPFQPQVLHSNSELLAGIASGRTAIPTLGGMIMTSPKQSPNVLIPLIRATDDGEDPVLAHWQYELGKTVAFTSGYWARWGQSWTQWPKFAKLWAQIVRWTMRQESPANFDTYTKIEGERATIHIDALDKDASYLNMLRLGARIVGPGQKAVPIEFVQTGPGHYEAQVDTAKSGQYLGSVQIHDASGKSLGTIRTGLSVPFSPEYRDLKANEPLLRQVAQVTGGRWLDVAPEQADVFSHDLPPTEAKRPAWEWVLAWLLLPLFLLDVAVRRLANWLALSIAVELVVLVVLLAGFGLAYGPWWGKLGAFALAELIGWSIRFSYIGPMFEWMTHSVTALGHAGDRSAVSLEQLRTTREKVRGDFDTDDDQTGDEAPPPIAKNRGKKRYDVGDEQGQVPVGDLSESLGGATEDASASKPLSKPKSGKDDEEASSMTSRLLRAKKRGKQDDNK